MVFNLSESLSQALVWIKQYWYIVALIIAGYIILASWLKRKERKIVYLNQVAENLKLGKRELQWNPTNIRFIVHRDKYYRVYGRIILGFRDHPKEEPEQTQQHENTPEQIREYEVERIKAVAKDENKPLVIASWFLVRRKSVGIKFLRLFFGEIDQIAVEHETDYTRPKEKVIRFHDDVVLIYRDGFFVKAKREFINIVTERTERLMKDHLINAVGQQQKDFSRVKSEWSHEELMVDKQADLEDKKEKGKRF